MEIETLRSPWVKGKATNFTGASYTGIVPTTTRPAVNANYGVIDLNAIGSKTSNALKFKFFGTSANNQNFNIRIWGGDECYIDPATSYEFVLLCELAITLGNLAGVTGTAMASTDFEADTIALTYGNDDVAVSIVSPANDVRGASILVDTQGSGFVIVDGDRNSSAASWNYLYKRM